MSAAQVFQLALTALFVAVLILLFSALILFHWRLWKEDRQQRAARRTQNKKE